MERKFPGGKRPPCYRCEVEKNAIYFWQKIAGKIRFFCLGCLGYVSEDGVIS